VELPTFGAQFMSPHPVTRLRFPSFELRNTNPLMITPLIYTLKIALGVIPILLGLHYLTKRIEDVAWFPHHWFRDVDRGQRTTIIRTTGFLCILLGLTLGIGVWFI